ncbi:MAG: 3-phosphoshikimate 1-carboxyvinyltransferase [Clostridia bacterium]|nr:3-phosphoshikimate 1-carboxyvinyltransferase [Clostridia bacterium]
MDIRITPNKLQGCMEIPPSKSYSHRALIAAALGSGEAVGVGDSADIEATRACLCAIKEKKPLFANESGSTLRFMIPLALVINGFVEISGAKRLMERPLDDYFKIFDEKKIEYSFENNTLYAKGKLTGGDYYIRGDVSSQFITGLLFALPLAEGDSRIIVTTKLESKAYVDMTIDVQRKFGIEIEEADNTYIVKGNQKYKNERYTVEGDFSQAAFFLAMGDVTLTGLNSESIQGDKEIVEVYRAMGMDIIKTDEGYISKGNAKKNIVVDVSQIPDCVPVLACVMALCRGEGKIVNAARLRIKESDRLAAICQELKNLGADITEGDDYLVIRGKSVLDGGVCSAHNDHRIAMAIATISPHCRGEVVIKGAECVAKSMPDFWERFNRLGGITDEFNMG